MDPLKALKFCPKCGKSEWLEKTSNFKTCKVCGYEMYRNPTIGAAGLAFDDKGRLLAVRRAKEPGKGTLAIPGGFCEAGERVEEAVCREILEETNIVVEVAEFLCDLPNDYVYHGVDLYPLDFFFKCNIKDMSRVQPDLQENKEIVFLKPEQIKIEDFGLPTHRKVLKRYFNI